MISLGLENGYSTSNDLRLNRAKVPAGPGIAYIADTSFLPVTETWNPHVTSIRRRKAMLNVGDPAPDFSGNDLVNGGVFTLSDHTGKFILVSFMNLE